ncbi:MAG: pre-peptidase C-terminal domain-containing protein [Spirochaetia bacterium]|nr:pre-peptidase C-terminal domain-containing protein [Spirochaetia bacterium]
MKKSLPFVALALLAFAFSCSSPLDAIEDNAYAIDKPEITRDYAERVPVMTSADAYEQDDSTAYAKTIAVNAVAQDHNFYDDATDWLKFTATAGTTYTIESWVFGYADTVLYLYYGTSTLKASNDDKASGDYGSRIVYTPTTSGTYYVRAYSYGGRYGTNRGYSISVTAGSGGGGTVTLPQPKKAWTVLVYLDADNNLSSYGDKDIAEMKAVGSTADVNVVVLWDNASSVHGYYYIQKNAATLLKDVGEVNMGTTTTANAFIDYAAANFPADKYMWVWWNHGAAVDRAARGVCWDDTNSGDHLSEVEQKTIMNYGVAKFGKKFEAVGFDACLMATGEIFYQYRNVANYMAASEQTEPGDGWNYAFLSTLTTTPTVTGDAATKAVFDTYKAWYASYSDVTFSTANLAYADDVGIALGDFASAAISSGVAGSTYKNLAPSTSFSGYTKDIVWYMNNIIASSAIPQTVKDKASAVKTLITGSLIRNNWSGSTWLNKAFGASITLMADTTTYSYLDLCVDTQWDEFLTFAGF